MRVDDFGRRIGRKQTDLSDSAGDDADVAGIPGRAGPVDDVAVPDNKVERTGQSRRRERQQHDSSEDRLGQIRIIEETWSRGIPGISGCEKIVKRFLTAGDLCSFRFPAAKLEAPTGDRNLFFFNALRNAPRSDDRCTPLAWGTRAFLLVLSAC